MDMFSKGLRKDSVQMQRYALALMTVFFMNYSLRVNLVAGNV